MLEDEEPGNTPVSDDDEDVEALFSARGKASRSLVDDDYLDINTELFADDDGPVGIFGNDKTTEKTTPSRALTDDNAADREQPAAVQRKETAPAGATPTSNPPGKALQALDPQPFADEDDGIPEEDEQPVPLMMPPEPPRDPYRGFTPPPTDNLFDESASQDPMGDLSLVEIDRDILSNKRYQRDTRKQGAFFLAALLLILLAGAQLAWFTFSESARNPALRPFYAGACQMLGCTLPGIQDVSLISTSKTFFTLDPQSPVYMVVDTLLTNKATEAQVYPDVEVEFRSLDDKLIARHRFTPAEYLGGEVTADDLMPPDVPVHIDMVVDNPGPAAVSRSVSVHANL